MLIGSLVRGPNNSQVWCFFLFRACPIVSGEFFGGISFDFGVEFLHSAHNSAELCENGTGTRKGAVKWRFVQVELVSSIEDLLREAQFRHQQFKLFIKVIWPGGFVGLKKSSEDADALEGGKDISRLINLAEETRIDGAL